MAARLDGTPDQPREQVLPGKGWAYDGRVPGQVPPARPTYTCL